MSSNPYNIDVDNAEQAIYALNQQVRDRVKEAEKKIREEMSELFEAARSKLRSAQERRDAQQVLINNAKVEKAASDDRIGLIYVEWKPKYGNCRELILSGKRGVCEVFTAEMRETSANPSRHPEQGHLIVRHLKKNGERAKTFEKFGHGFGVDKIDPPWGWHLEGESPK